MSTLFRYRRWLKCGPDHLRQEYCRNLKLRMRRAPKSHPSFTSTKTRTQKFSLGRRRDWGGGGWQLTLRLYITYVYFKTDITKSCCTYSCNIILLMNVYTYKYNTFCMISTEEFPLWRYTTHSGCVFYSPLSGFSLLAYKVT
jgi:hypothetical protein